MPRPEDVQDGVAATSSKKRQFMLVNADNHNEVLASFQSTHPKSAAEKALTRIAREAQIAHGKKVPISIADPAKEVVRMYEGYTQEVSNPTEFQKQHNISRERVVKYVRNQRHIMPSRGNLYQIATEQGPSIKIKCTRGQVTDKHQAYEATSACRQAGLNINNKQAFVRVGGDTFNVLNADGTVQSTIKGTMHFRGAITE